MATYACPKCGFIGDAQPCTACGAPTYDLAEKSELEALRFTLKSRARLRAGIGGGIGCVIGFIHSLWLQSETFHSYNWIAIAWVLALGSLGALLRPRAIAELDAELEARTGRASLLRRQTLATFAIATLVIIAETVVVMTHQAATMPRQDAERLVVKRTCELAETCSKAVMCIAEDLQIELEIGHARVDRSDVDACLDALDSLQRTHEVCSAPAPAACAAITSTTVPQLLRNARALERDIDGAIREEMRRQLDRALDQRAGHAQ